MHPGWTGPRQRSAPPGGPSCAGPAAESGCSCVDCPSQTVPVDSDPGGCGTAGGTHTAFCCSVSEAPRSLKKLDWKLYVLYVCIVKILCVWPSSYEDDDDGDDEDYLDSMNVNVSLERQCHLQKVDRLVL